MKGCDFMAIGRPKGYNNRKWTAEEKLRIVKRYLDDGIGCSTLEKEEGVSHRLILTWVEKYQCNGIKGLENKKKSGNRFAALHKSKTLTTEERLKLIIAQQEIEIERLKKGYFVRGDGLKKEFVITKDWSLKS